MPLAVVVAAGVAFVLAAPAAAVSAVAASLGRPSDGASLFAASP